jgi:hypothetical protein
MIPHPKTIQGIIGEIENNDLPTRARELVAGTRKDRCCGTCQLFDSRGQQCNNPGPRPVDGTRAGFGNACGYWVPRKDAADASLALAAPTLLPQLADQCDQLRAERDEARAVAVRARFERYDSTAQANSDEDSLISWLQERTDE